MQTAPGPGELRMPCDAADPDVLMERSAHVLLAGVDRPYFSCDLSISEEMRARLGQEQEAARPAAVVAAWIALRG